MSFATLDKIKRLETRIYELETEKEKAINLLRSTGMCLDGNGNIRDPASVSLEQAIVDVIETIECKYTKIIITLRDKEANK